MPYDPTLARKFDPIREPDEIVSWAGKPHFVPYLFSGLPILFIGCMWGLFDLNLMRGMRHEQLGFAVPFFALHLFPFWGALLYMLWLLLSFHNVVYALTNKRVILRGGVFAPSFTSYQLSQLSAPAVSVGPIDSSVGAGSVRFTYGYATSSRGAPAAKQERFRAVDDPYDVYRQLNESVEKNASKGPAFSAGA
jgi:hypothetical protein